MAVSDVTRLIIPPAHPADVGAMEQWLAVEQDLGFAFPSDYREFVFTYGTGSFAIEYSVFNPFWGEEYLKQVRYLCRVEKDFRVKFPNRVPFPIWPEAGGVFPWGSDQNGNYYLWETAGPPERWHVVTNEVRGLGYREHRCTMTEYLAGVLHGHIRPLIGDFPSADCFVFIGGNP